MDPERSERETITSNFEDQPDSRNDSVSQIAGATEGQIADPGQPQSTTKSFHADHVFDSMSSGKRLTTLFCIIMTNVITVGQLTTMCYFWLPEEEAVANNVVLVTLIASGFPTGSFLSLLVYRLLLRIFSRKGLYGFVLIFSTICYFIFASLNQIFGDRHHGTFYNIIAYTCLFFAGFCNGPIRSMAVATTTKLYPHKIGTMMQLNQVSYSLGAIITPPMGALSYYLADTIAYSFYAFNVASLAILVVICIIIPNTDPFQKKDFVMRPIQLLSTWRGCSNIMGVFLFGSLLKINGNGMTIFLMAQYNLSQIEVAFYLWFIVLFGLVSGLLNTQIQKLFDPRIPYVFFGCFGVAAGYLYIGDFFMDGKTPLYITIFAVMLTKWTITQSSAVNMDLTAVAKQVLQTENIGFSAKDVIGLLYTFNMSLSGMVGAVTLSVGLKFISYQLILSICGALITLNGLNYFFSSNVIREGFFAKRQGLPPQSAPLLKNEVQSSN